MKQIKRVVWNIVMSSLASAILLFCGCSSGTGISQPKTEQDKEAYSLVEESAKIVTKAYDVNDISVSSISADEESHHVVIVFNSEDFSNLKTPQKIAVLNALQTGRLVKYYKDIFPEGSSYRIDSPKLYVRIQSQGHTYYLSIIGTEDGYSSACLTVDDEVDFESATINGTPITNQPQSSASSKGEKCDFCAGTGTVKYYYGESALEALLSGKNDYEWGPCPRCHGTGEIK